MDKAVQVVVEVVLGIIVIGLLFFGLRSCGNSVVDAVQAPAKLDAALGNNQALAAGVGKQNAGIDALPKAAEEKKVRSRAAVAGAGKAEEKRAADIQNAPAVGDDDYHRAMNRIDRELHLQ